MIKQSNVHYSATLENGIELVGDEPLSWRVIWKLIKLLVKGK